MEPIEWPQEVSTDMKANITAGKVNELIPWIQSLESQVFKLKEKKNARKIKPRLRRSTT